MIVPGKTCRKLDLRHAGHAPTEKLNVILWKDAMGEAPVPAMLKAHIKKSSKDEDD